MTGRGDAAYGPSRIDLPTRRTKEIDLWIGPIGQQPAQRIRKENQAKIRVD
jgi:hypothetical protein